MRISLFFGFIFLILPTAQTQGLQFSYPTRIMILQQKVSLCEEDVAHLNNLTTSQNQTIHDLLIKLDQLENELTHTKTELHQTKTELNEIKTDLNQTKTKLNQTKTKLDQTKTELDQTKTELNQTKTELDQTKTQLNQTKTELDQTKTELDQTKTELKQTQERLIQSNEQLDIHKANEEICVKKKRAIEERIQIENVYNNIIKPEFQHLRRVEEYYKEEADATWVVPAVKNLLEGTPKGLNSTVFPLRTYLFGAKVELSINNKNKLKMAVYFENTTQTPMKLLPIPRAYLTLRNRNSSSKNIINGNTKVFNSLYPNFVAMRDLDIDLINNSPSYIDARDTLTIDIRVEAPEVSELVYSYDGTLIWAVQNYKENKEMAIQRLKSSCVSPYFYTSLRGYRVQASLNLNASDYDGLSVLIKFVVGRYDQQLESLFPHRTTVTIFHPENASQKITKSGEFDLDEERYYYMDMGSHEMIEKLLYNDILYYEVLIKAV